LFPSNNEIAERDKKGNDRRKDNRSSTSLLQHHDGEEYNVKALVKLSIQKVEIGCYPHSWLECIIEFRYSQQCNEKPEVKCGNHEEEIEALRAEGMRGSQYGSQEKNDTGDDIGDSQDLIRALFFDDLSSSYSQLL